MQECQHRILTEVTRDEAVKYSVAARAKSRLSTKGYTPKNRAMNGTSTARRKLRTGRRRGCGAEGDADPITDKGSSGEAV